VVRWSYSEHGVVVIKISNVITAQKLCEIVKILTQVGRQLSLSFMCWISIVLLLQKHTQGRPNF